MSIFPASNLSTKVAHRGAARRSDLHRDLEPQRQPAGRRAPRRSDEHRDLEPQRQPAGRGPGAAQEIPRAEGAPRGALRPDTGGGRRDTYLKIKVEIKHLQKLKLNIFLC